MPYRINSKYDCFFNYSSGFVFIVGIVIYLYFLILDYKEQNVYDISKQIWIYGFFILLLGGFFITYKC